MNHEHQMHQIVLSQGPVGLVSVCCCGTAHLTLGQTTIRLPAEQLREAALLLVNAVEALADGPADDHDPSGHSRDH